MATSLPASPKLRLTHKQTVSNHKEAGGGQCIWVSHIDLSPPLHGSGVRFLCADKRALGLVWCTRRHRGEAVLER